MPIPDVPPQGRVVLIVTSPRVAPGLLAWPAWERLRNADRVLCVDPDPEWVAALVEAEVAVEDLAEHEVAVRAGILLDATAAGEAGQGQGRSNHRGQEVVWLGSADGDPGLTDALAEHLARRAVAGLPPEVELLTGSHDVPGSRLLDLVAVMDRLRSPGGCPWDAEQTHRTLLPFLLEETHEVIEAVESGAADHLCEELGDLLLQVVFHARLAQEGPEPFDIDQVAAGIVAKLVSRHPHVFAEVEVDGSAEVLRNWEDLKDAEKRRSGLFEGIPATLPALARAQKMLGRLARAQALDGATQSAMESAVSRAADDDPLAQGLLELVQQARQQDQDAESALRAALIRLESGTM